MRYLDVCSGYSASSIAWGPLGWECAGYSEIEPFPRSVLEQRHGAVAVDWDHRHTEQSNIKPLFGDFTKIEAHHVGPIDLLVGGTPCQSFSIAGKRLGLDDPRGNLALEFLALARRLGAEWLVWENVPGVYSSYSNAPHDEGGLRCELAQTEAGDEWDEISDFHTFLSFVPECGYSGGWRTIDAQFVRVDGFGRAVPQRRRRVIFVGHLTDGARARSVLFDRESLCGNPAPSREARQSVAPTISARPSGGGGLGTDFDCDGGLIAAQYEDGSVATVSSKWAKGSGGPSGDECYNLVAQPTSHPLTTDGDFDQAGKETGLIAFDCKGTEVQNDSSGVSGPIRAMGHDQSHQNAGGHLAVAFKPSHYTRGKDGAPSDVAPPLSADADKGDQEAVVAVAGALCKDSFTGGASGRPEGAAAGHFIPTAFGFEDRHRGPEVNREAREPHFSEGVSPTMGTVKQPAVAFDMRGREDGAQLEGPHDTANIRAASGGSSRSYIAQQWAVRRLTPRECERLQGVPDDFTQIEWRGKPAEQCPDGPRYKAIGNSMAVNVMRWLGVRIQMIEQIKLEKVA